MPATLSFKYPTFLAQEFVAQLAETAVYFFIGQNIPWASESNPPAPDDDVQHISYGYWRDMLGVKRVSAANTSIVCARVDWTPNTIYAQYDDLDTALPEKTYYVLDASVLPYRVYKCLWNNDGGKSTVSPGTAVGTATVPTATNDGYVWQYLYTIDSTYYRFLTVNWMPVFADNTVQAAAVAAAGTLPTAVPLIILNAGEGYNAAVNVVTTLKGDGAGATVAVAGTTVTGGTIARIQLATGGNNYTQVTSINVYQAGIGTQAIARAIIPPYPNHGYDPVMELCAHSVMVSTVFDGAESGNTTIANDFRRVGLLVNPLLANGVMANADVYRMTTDITLSANTGVFQPDDAIVNMSKNTSPTASVVDVITSGNTYTLRVTSVDPQGQATPFSNGDTIRCVARSIDATVASVANPDLKPYSGHILWVNQRTPVSRTPSGTQEVKVVFSLGT